MALLFVASALIAQIVERFTWLIDLAAAVLAWTAAGLFLDDALVKSQFPALEPWGLFVRLGAIAFVLVIDLILRLARSRGGGSTPQVSGSAPAVSDVAQPAPETTPEESDVAQRRGAHGLEEGIAAMMRLLLVEDHAPVRRALREGLEATGEAQVIAEAATAREAIALAEANGEIEVALMDVELRDPEVGAEALSGVGAAVAIRRERPRFPVVFYSIQDDDTYFREFRAAGILSHYAYVRKSNYLLPSMLTPLLRDAIAGRSFIDPEIEDRVDEVRERDATSPRALLEPNELRVAELLAQGLTNEQIAARLGLRDARAVSRTNGRIYDAWRLSESATDEKVARARAALIYTLDRPIIWDEQGQALIPDRHGRWTPLFDERETGERT